jgi:HupE / UreJ protein
VPAIPRTAGRRIVAAIAAALVVGAVSTPSAHEIPADVTIQLFLKPEGRVAHLLVRVPLGSLIDIEWPMRSPQLLDLDKIQPYLYDASTLWLADNIGLYEGDTKLEYPRVVSVRAALPSDSSFSTYDEARAHLQAPPLTNSTDMYFNQGTLDAQFDYAIQSAGSRFSIRPKFDRLGLRVVTVLRYLPPDGTVRGFEYQGDAGLVRLDPYWYQAASHFAQMGFTHLVDGTDYLLFLLALVLPFRRLRRLAPIVLAFAAAQSVALIASAYGMAPSVLWFAPLVETLIAAAIVYVAFENIAVPQPTRRWPATVAFGLAYGFGFAFALQQTLQFAGAHRLASILSFDAGLAAGVVTVVALAVPAVNLIFQYLVGERTGTIIVSALVAHTGWHWLTDRWAVLRQFPIGLPVLDAAFLSSVLRWLMLIVALAGAAWLIQLLRRPPAGKEPAPAGPRE